MDTILILLIGTVVLLGGLIIYAFARFYRLPSAIFLIMFGMAIRQLDYVSVPEQNVKQFSEIILAFAVFVLFSRISFRNRDTIADRATLLGVSSSTIIILCTVIAGYFLFKGSGIEALLFLSLILISTEFFETHAKDRISHVTYKESSIVTPLAILAAYITYTILSNSSGAPFGGPLAYLLKQVVIGVGVGLISGLLLFRIMSLYYAKTISYALLITGLASAYALSLQLGGSGVIASAALGAMFSLMRVRKKEVLYANNSSAMEITGVLIFVLSGLSLPVYGESLLPAVILLCLYYACRWITINLLLSQQYSASDRAVAAFGAPKGIAAAALLTVAYDSSLATQTAFITIIASLAISLLVDLSRRR